MIKYVVFFQYKETEDSIASQGWVVQDYPTKLQDRNDLIRIQSKAVEQLEKGGAIESLVMTGFNILSEEA